LNCFASGNFSKPLFSAPLIHVAEGDDSHIPLARDGRQVSRALSAHADSRDANDFTGGHLTEAQHMSWTVPIKMAASGVGFE